MLALLLLPLLVAARLFLTVRSLALQGHAWNTPVALGQLLGSTVGILVVAVGGAALFRANRNRARLLLVANVAMLGSVAAAGAQLVSAKRATADLAAAPAAPAPAASSDPDAHIFEKDKWIADCMKHCRRNAPHRLPSLSPADREKHCSVSCDCGMAHMTDPGPGPGQVHAPSVRWQSETDEQHQAGAQACYDRATAEVNASHAHPG